MRKLSPGPLVVATHNIGKYEEVAELLTPLGFTVTSNRDHGMGEPDETEETFEGNALIKARAAATALNRPALADDSGRSVAHLDGAPGVRTADWAETPEGRDFDLAMQKVRDALGEAPPPWPAAFHCALALAWPDGESRIVEGVVRGDITWPPRGTKGHGYDPIFIPEGHSETFGEMDRWAKNQMSHRGRAMEAFLAECVDR